MFLALSLSDVVFIMLINAKMPTIIDILTFMNVLGWAWIKFYNLGVSSLFLSDPKTGWLVCIVDCLPSIQ